MKFHEWLKEMITVDKNGHCEALEFALDDGGQDWYSESLLDFLRDEDCDYPKLKREVGFLDGYLYLDDEKCFRIIYGKWNEEGEFISDNEDQ